MSAQGGSAGSAPFLRFALELDGKGGARSITLDEALGATAERPIWVHLDPRDDANQQWLTRAGVSEPDRHALARSRGRARVEPIGDDVVLLVLPSGLAETGAGRPAIVSPLRLWCSPGRLITVGEPPRPVVEDERNRTEQGRGARSVPGLLLAMAREGVDASEERVLDLDDAIVEAELRLDAGEELTSDQVRRLRQRLVITRARANPLRDLLLKIRISEVPWLEEHAATWRELANMAETQVEALDALLKRSDILLDHIEQHSRARTEQAVYIITLLSGIFLPLTFITGLLGVNLGGIPGSRGQNAFAILCGILAVLSMVLLWIVRRRGLVTTRRDRSRGSRSALEPGRSAGR